MSHLSKIIGILGLLITVVFTGSFLDTYNFIKFIVLILGTTYILVFWISEKGYLALKNQINKPPIYFLSILIIINCLSAITNGINYEVLFGTYGRQMGLISIFCLILISIMSLSVDSKESILKYLSIALTISNLYGLFQFMGIDIYKFEKLYDGINSTFGNPNFAGGAAAVSAVLYLHYFVESKKKAHKIIFSVLLFISFINIYGSLARQAYLTVIFGFCIYGYKWISSKPRNLKFSYLGFLAFSSVFTLLGMLQKGPLKTLVYKESISERGDFYRTAITTIKNNLFFGVGPDQFGTFYRIYRDVKQVSRTGINTTSDSAHNSLLHFGATSGIFAMLVLFLIYVWVVKNQAKVFFSSPTRAVTFSIWIVMSLQNMISVDHPSLSYWWWVVTALLIQNSHNEVTALKKHKIPKLNDRVILSHGFGFIGLIVIAIILVPQFRSQTLLFRGFTTPIDLENQETINYKRSLFESAYNSSPRNFEIYRFGANSFYQDGDFNSAVILSRKALEIQPNDYPSAWFLAESLTKLGKEKESILAWQKVSKLDPLNFRNHFELGKLLAKSDISRAKIELSQSLKLYPDEKTKEETIRLLASIS